MRRTALGPPLVLLALVPAAVAPAHRLARAPRCPILPPSNAWNQRVDAWPVARNSSTLVRSIGLGAHAHADFGSGRYQGRPIGIPFDVVGRRTRRTRVSFDYAGESDRVRYPIPGGVRIEGGSDRHALLVDRDACRLYELFALERRKRGRPPWHAGSGAVFDLRSNRVRPRGWTSADAAGLPILPGLARPEDVGRGGLDHALRFTAPRTRRAFVLPARHFASSSNDPALPPMGIRIRLKRSARLGGLGPQARAVALGLKRYGALLADNGAPWFFSGTPDARWHNDDLRSLGRLSGRDFEVVRAPPRRRPRALRRAPRARG